MKKNLAEFIGTFCASDMMLKAVLAAGIPDIGIGLVGVSIACWIDGFNNCIFLWSLFQALI